MWVVVMERMLRLLTMIQQRAAGRRTQCQNRRPINRLASAKKQTFGVRIYAHKISKILDEEGHYFSHH
jgi:hypothetical protein